MGHPANVKSQGQAPSPPDSNSEVDDEVDDLGNQYEECEDNLV